ncbi:hypothetical protein Leryth_005944 [Lithospermum erythrorhizon]|nr:hypothetical protein Leryth_005944 [Lithospermum erythrorhizon]
MDHNHLYSSYINPFYIEYFTSHSNLSSFSLKKLVFGLASIEIIATITMPEAPNNTHKNANSYSVAETNKKAFQFIEDVTTKPDEVQKRVLAEILSRNANVEYFRRHGLKGQTDRETFKKTMPVITYEDIQEDINRIADGDKSPIICSQPISEFLTSSGTSGGERKLMPTIEEELGRRSLLYSLLMPVMSQCVPNLEKGKGMYFLFIKSESKTPGGLLARPVLTSYYEFTFQRKTI